LNSWFNEQLEADERATLLSFNSTLSTLGGSMGLIVGGVIADRTSIQRTWQFGGLLLLAVVPCYFLGCDSNHPLIEDLKLNFASLLEQTGFEPPSPVDFC
jgi:MFS family permease